MNTGNTREEAKLFLDVNGYPNPDSNFLSEMLDTMVEYAQSKLKTHVDLDGVSGCSFALWLQDNYSTNEKQGSDKPLPKGYWRKDFTDEIHKVEDLWVVFNNR